MDGKEFIKALDHLCVDVSIKWPNDIILNNKNWKTLWKIK